MYRSVFVAGILALFPVALTAQTVQTQSGRTEYTPDDFAQFAPRTARDMVEQIPGFTLEDDDDGSRGFGEATGNVLINGLRLSGKSNSPADALGRIPASSVEKIEILDGTALDIPGLSGQVVNVVAKTDGVSGSWTWWMRFRENLPPAIFWFESSITGQNGDLAWTLGLAQEENRGGSRGRENIFDGTRTIIETRGEDYNFIGTEGQVSASLSWTPPSGTIANLNAELATRDVFEREISKRFPLDNRPDSTRLFKFSEDEWNTEIGGDYEFGLGPGRLKLIGLYRFEHSPFLNSVSETPFDTSPTIRAQFEQIIDESESILRTEYGWSAGEGRDWQISLEGAFNTLDEESRFQDTLGAPIDFTGIPFDEASVEERRGETFLTHTRRLTPRWSTQLALGAEYSEIEASGGDKPRSFTRPKGFASVTYEASDSLTITGKLSKEVGQLNFFDFVNSRNLSVGDSDAGNPDIVPEQSWLAELEFEKSFGEAGAHTLRLYYEDIEDPIDRVPFGPFTEGPGNLDSATRYGFELDSTFKFDPIGLNGLQLTMELEGEQSEIEDPVTGQQRELSETTTIGGVIELRYDRPNTDWAYGIAIERFDNTPGFRLDQTREFRGRPGVSWAFIEHKDIYGMTGTFYWGNLLDQDDEFTRVVYSPRRDGELAFIEDRSRNFGNIFTLRLKGTF